MTPIVQATSTLTRMASHQAAAAPKHARKMSMWSNFAKDLSREETWPFFGAQPLP
jgi:hypothetical protein